MHFFFIAFCVCVCVCVCGIFLLKQAVKDDIGTIRIQRPHKGPFYVSPKNIDELIANLGKWTRWFSRYYHEFAWVFLLLFHESMTHIITEGMSYILRSEFHIFHRWYQYASMGFTVYGVYLLAKRAIQYIMGRKRRRDLQTRWKLTHTHIDDSLFHNFI